MRPQSLRSVVHATPLEKRAVTGVIQFVTKLSVKKSQTQNIIFKQLNIVMNMY